MKTCAVAADCMGACVAAPASVAAAAAAANCPFTGAGFVRAKGCGQPRQPCCCPHLVLIYSAAVANDVATSDAADDAIMLQARASASVTRILTRLPPTLPQLPH